jgi:hypothetical protein
MNQFPGHDVLEDVQAPAAVRYLGELTRRIDTLTQRQICDLQVLHSTHKVVLNGRSKSYYVKQLASQAVIDLLPGITIENSIDVLA